MIDINTLTAQGLAALFDHTLLRPDATHAQLSELCAQARHYGFKMVAINSAPVAFCRKCLEGSPIHVGAAISFPLGQTTTAVKLTETEHAIGDGADEIDYVVNLTQVKQGDWGAVEAEMAQLTKLCRMRGVILKAIFENCYLTKEEIRTLSEIARNVRPDFIKTSTGFGPSGADTEDVRLMKQTVGGLVSVKAAGGIRSWDACRAMLEAGAERIGTSSSVKILEEFRVWRDGQ